MNDSLAEELLGWLVHEVSGQLVTAVRSCRLLQQKYPSDRDVEMAFAACRQAELAMQAARERRGRSTSMIESLQVSEVTSIVRDVFSVARARWDIDPDVKINQFGQRTVLADSGLLSVALAEVARLAARSASGPKPRKVWVEVSSALGGLCLRIEYRSGVGDLSHGDLSLAERIILEFGGTLRLEQMEERCRISIDLSSSRRDEGKS